MSLSRGSYSARYTSKGMITIMGDKDIIERSNIEQLSFGKDPTKLIFTALTRFR
jgi:hypothetical protein